MRLIIINRKIKLLTLMTLVVLLLLCLVFWQYKRHNKETILVMGGNYLKQTIEQEDSSESKKLDVETYFRPSDLPVLNNRYNTQFFDDYFGKKASKIKLPKDLLATPEETILNYYSILREAANHEEDKGAGCGSLGNGKIPYPVAYNFLSSQYKKKLNYKEYLNTFKNILHINLIKYREIPIYDNLTNKKRYFVELETIEGTEKYTGVFAYYYGFVDLVEENGRYYIDNLEFVGEDYLCAPYHGWSHDAEASVQIRYGGWCSMIKEMYPIVQDGYRKNVSFKGTDGNDYLIVFYQLTNDTDIEISQYKKQDGGEWELIKLNPEDCLKEKVKE